MQYILNSRHNGTGLELPDPFFIVYSVCSIVEKMVDEQLAANDHVVIVASCKGRVCLVLHSNCSVTNIIIVLSY